MKKNILFPIVVYLQKNFLFIFFFLDEKETKNQDETPTPFFVSHEKPSHYRLKKHSSLRFALSAALLPKYAGMCYLLKFSPLFLLLCFSVVSCKKSTSAIEGYTRDNEGFYFKLIALGDGNEHPTTDQVIVVDAVMKTQADSVFWDTKHDAQNGLYISLSKNEIKRSCNSYFLNLVEGDSASLYVNPKAFFRNYFDTDVPAFCTKDTLIKLDIKLTQIISKAEYIALKKMAEFNNNEDTELEELQSIYAYLSHHYPKVEADCDGLFTLEKNTTSNEKVSSGKHIKIEFEGFFLDGKPIDNTKQQLEFNYGTPDQLIKGLNIVIGTLKKGEFVKIIVPSRLAFGEKGSSNGSIQPYTPLVYNIKIIDIK